MSVFHPTCIKVSLYIPCMLYAMNPDVFYYHVLGPHGAWIPNSFMMPQNSTVFSVCPHPGQCLSWDPLWHTQRTSVIIIAPDMSQFNLYSWREIAAKHWPLVCPHLSVGTQDEHHPIKLDECGTDFTDRLSQLCPP